MAPIRGPGVNRRSFLAILAAATGLGWLGLRGGGGGVPIIPGPARTDEESWRKLLAELSGLAIADPEIRPLLTGEQVARRWLGEPPAEEEEIATAERRLGTRLPGSYRAFLRVSNGWHHPSSFVGLVSPVAAVAPFAQANRDWAMAYVAPSLAATAAGALRPDPVGQHILGTLQLSRYDHEAGDDAVMLLNPATLSAAGEMEAWFFANWVPGANIYPSFWHLMVAERDSLRYIASRR